MAQPEKQAGTGGLSTVPNVESIPGSAPAPTSDKARYSWVLTPGLEVDSSGKVGSIQPKAEHLNFTDPSLTPRNVSSLWHLAISLGGG